MCMCYLSWPWREAVGEERKKKVCHPTAKFIYEAFVRRQEAARNFCATAVFPWLGFMATRMAVPRSGVRGARAALPLAGPSDARHSLFAGSASLTQ